MRTFLAATVTLEDLKTYFKHGGETPLKKERWRSKAFDGEDESGAFTAQSPTYEVDLKPKGIVFHVKIEAVDDPSDSDEAVTDDPSGFIVDFMKTGTAGDEVFGKMAGLVRRTDRMSPQDLSGLLRFVASEAESGRMTKRRAAAAVRRSCVLLDVGGLTEAVRAAARIAADLGAVRTEAESSAVGKLRDTLEKKGWKTKVGEDDRGMPRITVDVAGVYEASITVDHATWQFKFQLVGNPETVSEGVTDDPIEEFESFYKNPEIREARKEVSERREEKSVEDQDKATAPPPKRKSPAPGE